MNLSECRLKMTNLSTFDREKLLYMWVKTGYISLSEFHKLLPYVKG